MGKALLVIDVQQGMFAFHGLPPHDGEAVVARIADLVERARCAEIPIFFVQHDGGPRHPLSKDTSGFPFRMELTPEPADSVIVKRNCNSFQDTNLDALLRAAGIDHLIVCGMQTEYCVDTAVRAAFERGYRITLAGDAHTTFDNGVMPAAAIVAHHNKTLDGGFCTVQPAAAVPFTD